MLLNIKQKGKYFLDALDDRDTASWVAGRENIFWVTEVLLAWEVWMCDLKLVRG